MMKQWIFLSLMIMAATCLSAQSRWAFGVDLEGGVSGEKTVLNDDLFISFPGNFTFLEERMRRPGMSAGVWAEFLLSHHFGLRLGTNYGQLTGLGQTEYVNLDAQDQMVGYYRSRLYLAQRQLRIPLTTKLYLGSPLKRNRFFLSAGVQWSYLLKQRNIVDNFSGGNGQTEISESAFASEVDFSHEHLEVNRAQFSPLLGIGFSSDRITLSLQRTFGPPTKSYNASLGGLCDCATCDCAFPSFVNEEIKHLQLTSLRFAYRLF